jgi:hypothetical protein
MPAIVTIGNVTTKAVARASRVVASSGGRSGSPQCETSFSRQHQRALAAVSTATTSIPVVGVDLESDSKSLARPGGNSCGVSPRIRGAFSSAWSAPTRFSSFLDRDTGP